MGKKTKLREAQRQHAADTIAAVLTNSKRRAEHPALVATYGDFKWCYRDTIEPYRALAVRAPEKWRCRIKSRSEDDRFVDLAKFTFARFPLAAHFDSIWLRDINDTFVDQVDPIGNGGLRPDLRHWYIVAGAGGSLHAHATHRFFTRGETHHFLGAPAEVRNTAHALWYAVARAADADHAAALAIARTRLIDFSVASTFWKSVARFFASSIGTVDEMDGLIEYIHAARHHDTSFSLKGRSLAGLRERRDAWHHAENVRRFGGAWEGRALPDIDYTTASGDGAVTWRFRQIKTGFGLHEEGRLMGHCVATYQARCASGESTIWSLASQHPDGTRNKRLTIEVRHTGTIDQCRGHANRFASPEEAAIVKRWATGFGLHWCG